VRMVFCLWRDRRGTRPWRGVVVCLFASRILYLFGGGGEIEEMMYDVGPAASVQSR
jgi:hypothetical protein